MIAAHVSCKILSECHKIHLVVIRQGLKIFRVASCTVSSVYTVSLISGQHGVRGVDPPTPDKSYRAKSAFESSGIEYAILAENLGLNIIVASVLASIYQAYGGMPRPKPGKGGNGGKAGLGGLTGETFFVGINQEPMFSVFNNAGK